MRWVSNAFSSIVKNKVDRIKKDEGSNHCLQGAKKKGKFATSLYAMEKSSKGKVGRIKIIVAQRTPACCALERVGLIGRLIETTQ